MRTTLEITDQHRAELLRIASMRGMKGFSAIVQEAIEEYLRNQADKAERIEAALATRGALSDDEAEDFAQRVAAIREEWR